MRPSAPVSASTFFVADVSSCLLWSDLQFTLVAKGYTVVSSDKLSEDLHHHCSLLMLIAHRCFLLAGYPTNQPQVYGVSGCITQTGNKTSNCPTAGGKWLTLTGKNFIAPVSATVNGQSCSPTRNVITSKFECLLPESAGFDQAVVVTANSQFSSFYK
jgi:hypothetical protein